MHYAVKSTHHAASRTFNMQKSFENTQYRTVENLLFRNIPKNYQADKWRYYDHKLCGFFDVFTPLGKLFHALECFFTAFFRKSKLGSMAESLAEFFQLKTADAACKML